MATTRPSYRFNKAWFDHIKIDHTNWDGTCPLEDDFEEINNPGEIDLDSDHVSWLLAQILDRPGWTGTREIVSNRRRVMLMEEYVRNTSGERPVKSIIGGSVGDGFVMIGGDLDTMIIDTDVVVTYPDQYHFLPDESRHKTVLFMREADCQSGYVALEARRVGQTYLPQLSSAVVPVGDSMFIASDIFRQGFVEVFQGQRLDAVSSGPCCTVKMGAFHGDLAASFPCTCWPKEAEEWVHRTRLYGWPSRDLVDKIVRSGCQLVPVGDKCSQDTFLQWRISFLIAERALIHSLSHQQFRIYGLLKYFLKQLKDLLENIIGDGDIVCSYFMKTLIFYAVENSPSTFWKDKYTFSCFRFCLRILMDWIKKGNCPNYFIQNNNMFKRKVHGENQQKLLHILKDMYAIKWSSISAGTAYWPSIGEVLHQAFHGRLCDILPARVQRECERDTDIFLRLAESVEGVMYMTRPIAPLRLLSESQSDTDEFIAHHLTATILRNIATSTFTDRKTPGGNKQMYKTLRKCKRLLTPRAAMCANPGLLELATFHYLTGNYIKTLEMCEETIAFPRWYIGEGANSRGEDRYQGLYCGRGYSLYHKLKEGCANGVDFDRKNVAFCLPHLHLELIKDPLGLYIPPLPYAVFLSFLCYHDLGDTRRRDAALLQLRAVNYDPEQGGHKHWIVHTLLGICYQTVGDNHRAIQAYIDSVHIWPAWNPAIERIEALWRSE